MDIKRGVYHAVVMSTLLYGSETWMVKSPSMKCLEEPVYLGVSRATQ